MTFNGLFSQQVALGTFHKKYPIFVKFAAFVLLISQKHASFCEKTEIN